MDPHAWGLPHCIWGDVMALVEIKNTHGTLSINNDILPYTLVKAGRFNGDNMSGQQGPSEWWGRGFTVDVPGGVAPLGFVTTSGGMPVTGRAVYENGATKVRFTSGYRVVDSEVQYYIFDIKAPAHRSKYGMQLFNEHTGQITFDSGWHFMHPLEQLRATDIPLRPVNERSESNMHAYKYMGGQEIAAAILDIANMSQYTGRYYQQRGDWYTEYYGAVFADGVRANRYGVSIDNMVVRKIGAIIRERGPSGTNIEVAGVRNARILVIDTSSLPKDY